MSLSTCKQTTIYCALMVVKWSAKGHHFLLRDWITILQHHHNIHCIPYEVLQNFRVHHPGKANTKLLIDKEWKQILDHWEVHKSTLCVPSYKSQNCYVTFLMDVWQNYPFTFPKIYEVGFWKTFRGSFTCALFECSCGAVPSHQEAMFFLINIPYFLD